VTVSEESASHSARSIMTRGIGLRLTVTVKCAAYWLLFLSIISSRLSLQPGMSVVAHWVANISSKASTLKVGRAFSGFLRSSAKCRADNNSR
jgi:hypothetical protein